MLHIILLILKIIAIIIAVILGILLLLIGTILFMPLKYEALSDCNGTLDGLNAYLKCTWFFRMIRVVACYNKKKFQWKLKLLWFQFPKEEVKEYEEKYEEKLTEAMEETKEEYQNNTKSFKGIKEEMEKEPTISERVKTKREEIKEIVPEQEQKNEKTDNQFKKSFEKIKKIYEKIKCTIQNLCDKIKMLLQSKDSVVTFIQKESHKNAFLKLKREAIHLLKRLKPKKLKVNIHYGFENPCTTGQVLAGLAVIYPLIGKHANIVPDFEKKVLEGDFHIKGRIRGVYFAILAWNLFWCKDVRTTYKDIRSFKV